MKSNCTIQISRDKAIDLILSQMNRKVYEEMDNKLLLKLLKELGFGDNVNLPYHKTNIEITDNG